MFIVKNGIEEKNQNVGYAASKTMDQKNSDTDGEYSGCGYYKAQTEEIKKAFMRDLGIASGKDLAAFLEDLKNNPDKRKELGNNKKPASYNIELLLHGKEIDGKKIPGDLENYEKAIKNICDSNGKDVAFIKTNIEIIKILAGGLKSKEFPEDNIDDIWPKEYLEKEQ